MPERWLKNRHERDSTEITVRLWENKPSKLPKHLEFRLCALPHLSPRSCIDLQILVRTSYLPRLFLRF